MGKENKGCIRKREEIKVEEHTHSRFICVNRFLTKQNHKQNFKSIALALGLVTSLKVIIEEGGKTNDKVLSAKNHI